VLGDCLDSIIGPGDLPINRAARVRVAAKVERKQAPFLKR
jgi:hypothetical protein